VSTWQTVKSIQSIFASSPSTQHYPPASEAVSVEYVFSPPQLAKAWPYARGFVRSFGAPLPIVMAVANRALSAPINIHGDHSDMMASRDCGWVQIFVEDVQEAYDWTIMAFKIAEDANVQLPVAVNLDGFTLTHCMMDLKVLKDEDVAKFVGKRKAELKLDPENPISYGSLALPEYYLEIKRQQVEALENAHPVTEKFWKPTARHW